MRSVRLQIILLVLPIPMCLGQSLQQMVAPTDADSSYVRKFILKNDVRLFYGGQGNNLSLGSNRDDKTEINTNLYKNTNDYIGAGITYGWLDGDISYSLPGTTYLKEERSNLKQFKLAFGYTRRKLVFRWCYRESTGVVISDSGNEFVSTASLYERQFGMQITYLLNPLKYSYRASMYQSEYQLQTAGSFLLRFDPFYRKLGVKDGSMIPAAYDIAARFGEQTGLEYVESPGLLVLPGYGINIVIRDTRLFISPIVFAGVGVAQNRYEAAGGPGNFTSMEYAASAVLNAGYNGSKVYSKIQLNWSTEYTLLDPTYLTNSNFTCVLTVGMRFQN